MNFRSKWFETSLNCLFPCFRLIFVILLQSETKEKTNHTSLEPF